MRCIYIACLVLPLVSALAWGIEAAKPLHETPLDAKALEASLHPMPQSQVGAYLDKLTHTVEFDDFMGQNSFLKSADNLEATPLQIGLTVPVDMASSDLMGAGFHDDGYSVFLAGLRSVDAVATRAVLDLSRLREDEEVWMIDPTGPRAFGPYTRADDLEGGCALPTCGGDTCVLMLRSLSGALPDVRVHSLAHIYGLSFFKEDDDNFDCHVDVMCESGEAIQEASRAIGFLIILSDDDRVVGGGSGSLISSYEAPRLGPCFLTANHVINTHREAANTEIVWDFRSDTCNGSDLPVLADLPRSRSLRLLATSATLDLSLLELDRAPGRVPLGWSTRRPDLGERAIGIHHPDWGYMRLSEGYAAAVNLDPILFDDGTFYEHENLIYWERGITQPGSSGSPILFEDASGSFQVLGALSGSVPYDCDDYNNPNGAVVADYYSSFGHFYIVDFPDPGLDAAIRSAIGKPEGAIGLFELVGVGLAVLNAENMNIRNLTGLEFCADLRTINLKNNRIADITPVLGLAKVNTLELANNELASIEPLLDVSWLNVGDLIDLRGNPVTHFFACDHVRWLRQQGATVQYDEECAAGGCRPDEITPGSSAGWADLYAFAAALLGLLVLARWRRAGCVSGR